jgi:hypothetical protein
MHTQRFNIDSIATYKAVVHKASHVLPPFLAAKSTRHAEELFVG